MPIALPPRNRLRTLATLVTLRRCLLVATLTAAAAGSHADDAVPASTLPDADPDCLAAAAAAKPDAARAACRTDNPLDAYNLALVLYDSAPQEARAALESAADAGLPEANQVLGNMLLDAGAREAGMRRLKAAAFTGLALAQYDYATALVERNEPGDLGEAVRWYGRAAAGGENAARYNIAMLLLGGHAGPPAPVDAWAWLSSMEVGGSHAEVRKLASRLSGEMSAADRSAAAAALGAIRADPLAASGRLADRLAAATAAGAR